VLSTMGAADAVKTVSSIAPHASSATRRAIVHMVFRHDFRWPLPMTEQFLKDDDAEIRRLAVMKVVTERLLTPVGLRSLAPGHPDYKPTYDGDLRSRDAAYHQGTVWGWLIGPYVDAWLRVHPGEAKNARRFLEGFIPHLGESCLGSISEVFDAEPPYTPRGCVAQAWSVAEVLRCWVKTSGPEEVEENLMVREEAVVTG